MSYPKWVKRSPSVGDVLCQSAAEERQLLEDWRAETGEDLLGDAQPAAGGVATDAELTAITEARAQLATERAEAEKWFESEQSRLEETRKTVADLRTQLEADTQAFEAKQKAADAKHKGGK